MYGFGLIGPDTGPGQTYDASALYQSALADPASQFRAGRVGVRGGTAMPAAPAQGPPPGMVYQQAQPSPNPAAPGMTPATPSSLFNGTGQYMPRYDANALWQQAMQDPMSQFRVGRVGVRGFGTFTPPGVGGSAPANTGNQQMPQLGNFYTPYSPGDAQNLPTSTIGSNFLGEYAARKRDTSM